MRLIPLTDRVVIKRAEEKKGIIIIPDAAKEKPAQGEVVAVGPGRRNEEGKLIPTEVRVGDQVLFGKYSATEIEVGGEELLVVREDDVLGVLG